MRRAVALALGLAGCGGVATPPVAVPAVTVPAGWIEIAPPDDERRHCANYAEDEWQVAIDHGALAITAVKEREADTGPPLPFVPDVKFDAPPRKHVLAVSGGFLVGFDAGEWGGALYWFSADGTNATKLADENVRGLVALGPELVGAIEGLAHLALSEGAVRWLERPNASARWRATALSTLDGAPRTFARVGDAIDVLTTESLERIGKDRKAVAVQPVNTERLNPESMASDASGALWIGMRQFVVRLAPVAGGKFAETWFVRETCRHATVHDLTCICSKLGAP